MFAVEMTAGQMARSQALQADALDFFADAVTYGISLAVIGASIRVRTTAAAAKGISLFLMGLWVFGSTIWRVFYNGVPEAPIMGVIGLLALAANLLSVLLLVNYKDGDANVRSVPGSAPATMQSANVIVMIAALGVWGTATAWPDLAVARHHGRPLPVLLGPDPAAVLAGMAIRRRGVARSSCGSQP
jgi:Co/Zn/Cd efflux system component